VNISKIPKVKQESLSKMTVSTPRAPLKNPVNSETIVPQKSTKMAKKKRGAKRKPSAKSPPKLLKSCYQYTFRTMTQSLGCLSACIQRATTLSRGMAHEVAAHIEDAVHVLNSARIIAYEALSLYVIATLESPSTSTDTTNTDPLDLLLTKKFSHAIVRSLVTLIINGKIKTCGSEYKDQKSVQSKMIAEAVYSQLISTTGKIDRLNTNKELVLNVPQKCMSHEIANNIRSHFKKLPFLIVNKVQYT
jgi:ribosomal protein L17